MGASSIAVSPLALSLWLTEHGVGEHIGRASILHTVAFFALLVTSWTVMLSRRCVTVRQCTNTVS